TLAGLDLTHQTGAADLETVRAAYAARGLAARGEPFIADMGGAYAAADLVVARAGATTCAALTAVGRPRILAPSASPPAAPRRAVSRCKKTARAEPEPLKSAARFSNRVRAWWGFRAGSGTGAGGSGCPVRGARR